MKDYMQKGRLMHNTKHVKIKTHAYYKLHAEIKSHAYCRLHEEMKTHAY